MDVIIFGGQSNMQGQSEALLPAAPVENACEYRYLTDSVIPLQDPVGENIRYDGSAGVPVREDTDLKSWLSDHVTGSACYGNTNLVPGFCRAYTQTSGREVMAVHIAKGSTTLTQWLKGTPGYAIIREKAAAAIRRVPNIGHIDFVWLQGESDAIEGCSKQDYKDRLVQLQRDLTADLGVESFGVIRVGRFTGDARDEEIIRAQDEVCREQEPFMMLTDIATELNEMPGYMHPSIPGHFSARGLEKLGMEAGKALGQARGRAWKEDRED